MDRDNLCEHIQLTPVIYQVEYDDGRAVMFSASRIVAWSTDRFGVASIRYDLDKGYRCSKTTTHPIHGERTESASISYRSREQVGFIMLSSVLGFNQHQVEAYLRSVADIPLVTHVHRKPKSRRTSPLGPDRALRGTFLTTQCIECSE